MIKKILFAAIPLAAIGLTACSLTHTTAQDGVVLRKMIKDDSYPTGYEVWVKYIKDDTESVISYDIREDYYNRVEIGDTFNEEYAISKGVTEYEYSW